MECDETATHKLKSMDSTTIYVCDEHLKEWLGCVEILPLKTRIVKNRFKIAVALTLITNLAWATFYYALCLHVVQV